jgi:hypothetical protein
MGYPILASRAGWTFSTSSSNGNSGECAPISTSPSSGYLSAQARTQGRVRSQLTHEKVQNWTTTTFPRSPDGVRGSELSQAVAPPRSGSAPSMGNSAVAVNAVT